METKTFICEVCGKRREAGPDDEIPDCCGQPMSASLAECTKPFDAEHARLDHGDEPCDDGIRK